MAALAIRAGARREWLTIHEASTLIGVSSATLRRWSDAGDIRAFTTPGGHRRFSRAAVMSLVPSNRRERPNLERLGETTEHLARVYRRHLREAILDASWIGELAAVDRQPFRDQGRVIAESLLGFFDAPTSDEAEAAIGVAEAAADAYGRMAGARGASMSDTVAIFLRFRLPFIHELAGMARRRALDTAQATDLLERATEVIDRLIGALLRGHEAAARTTPTSPEDLSR
jgi:excisionase family DNA binding protein